MGVFSDGEMTYKGEWRDGDYHGYGIHEDEFGMYVGEFLEGVRHGEVSFFFQCFF